MSFLTSLVSALKGGGDVRVPVAGSFVAPWSTVFDTSPSRPGFDYSAAIREAYLANPVAQRSVRIVAEGIGGAPLVCDTPALERLVQCACGSQPLLETVAAQLLLHGNAYFQVVKDAAGDPVDLHPLRPERVEVVAGADGWPALYRYRVGEQAIDLALADADGWPEIVHLKGFHPADDHYGAGCLAAAHGAVAVHNAASEWNRALLTNAARPSGALVYDTGDGAGLTADQFERLKSELAQAFQGAGNAGRPMLLEGGLSWQSMSLSPADMDFAALKAGAARDIALAFGVPPMLLGLPGDNTYSNYREANRALWRLTLLPLAKRVLDGLVQGLEPWFGNASLRVDLDQVPALAEDREKMWSQIGGADFLSDDEKRELLGLEVRA